MATMAGCATPYQPALSPRVAIVGNQQVMRDGMKFGSIAFGTPDAVQANPRAFAEAQTGKNMTVGGIVVGVTGLAAAGGALIYAGNDNSRQGVALAGLGVEIVSLVIALTLLDGGTVHSTNAINIYNDGLSPSAPLRPPASENEEPARAHASLYRAPDRP
ncbi:MAG: hypothetical protein ABW061_14675 [Polyangiaceae bacterium]